MLDIKNNRKALSYIFLYYCFTQILILIVEGKWYDDWCIVNISKEGLCQWALEMGKPEVYPIALAIQTLPEICYKLFIFISYLLVAICFYYIAKNVLSLSDQNALLLVLIYLAIPGNDIRIERLGIPYTVGLLFFSVSFCLLVLKYHDRDIKIRIVTLIMFFVSFILNSNLVFYGMVLLFILYKERKMKSIIKNVDYFLLPFSFFFCKVGLFPAHGVYSGYNQVNIAMILRAMKNVIMADGIVLAKVVSTTFWSMSYVYSGWIWIIGGLLASAAFLIRKKIFIEPIENEKQIIWKEFIIGGIMLTAGLFPYVAVQGNPYIEISGFNGRYFMLAPFGIAMLIDSFLRITCNTRGKKIFLSLFMIAGFVYFNKSYTGYQVDSYWVRGLQENLRSHVELKECSNIYIVGNVTNFYVYNGIFEEVYGDQKRMVFDASSSLTPKTVDDTTIEREWYNMTDYERKSAEPDAIILYSNSISSKDALLMRMAEIFNKDIRKDLLNNTSFQVIYPEEEGFEAYVS